MHGTRAELSQRRSAAALASCETLSPTTAAALRAVVTHCGESRAAHDTGLSRWALARALAGLSLRRGTVALIESRLRALGHLSPAK